MSELRALEWERYDRIKRAALSEDEVERARARAAEACDGEVPSWLRYDHVEPDMPRIESYAENYYPRPE